LALAAEELLRLSATKLVTTSIDQAMMAAYGSSVDVKLAKNPLPRADKLASSASLIVPTLLVHNAIQEMTFEPTCGFCSLLVLSTTA
jgi:hypothetical protein